MDIFFNIIRFFFTLILISSLSPAFVYAKPTSAVLLFGDSLSAAYGIDQAKGWGSLLEQRLKQNNLPFRVVNASISGDTTQNGLSRISTSLAKHQPHVVIIELGANDGLRGLSLKQMNRNLASMIELSQKNNTQVVLAGMRIPPNYGKRYTDAFYETYVSLARQYNVVLIPFLLNSVAGQQHLMQEDGLHPNEIAQPLIVDNVWPYLLPLLNK